MLIEQEWVNNLKEGDGVAINVGTFNFPYYKVTKITKVTPTRIIKTDSGHVFNNDGYERGKSSVWDIAKHIQPVTTDILDHIEKANLLSKIKDTKFSGLQLGTLREIVNLINRSDIDAQD